jgi:O-antigen/teichoic acid export membrane protein
MANTSQSIRAKAVSGLMWRFLERFGAQGVTFAVSVILARLLDPGVYGTIAIVTVFTAVLNVFTDSGLGNALVQKKDADDLDFSTVFIFNMGMCLVLYGLLFVSSPLIASFYRMPDLAPVLRFMSLTVVLSGVKNIQQAYVARHLMFRRFFFATLGGTLGAAALGIWMALRGYGVWALAAQSVFNCAVDTLILWITVGWRPNPAFSADRFRGLFSYGWKILVSTLINTVNNDLRQLVIGKLYTPDSLAFYNRGYMIPNTFVGNINTAIDSVLLPVLSGAQDDRESVLAMTRRSIRIGAYVMWPVMMGIAAVSEPLVRLLLTEKWLPCVPFVIIFFIRYGLMPLTTAVFNAVKALGRSDIFLRLTVIQRIFGFAVLFATMWSGPLIIALGGLVIGAAELFINAVQGRRLLGYGYRDQAADILPPILLSLGMAGIVWTMRFLGLSDPVTLVLQVLTGVLIYTAGSVFFRFESFYYLLNMARRALQKRKERS